MAQEYHSKLISELYKAKNEEEAYKVLQEMEEVMDVSFLYPIYEAYKKYEDKSLGFVFIDSIYEINSPDSIVLIKKIAKEYCNDDDLDFTTCLGYLEKNSDFDDIVISRAKLLLEQFYLGKKQYLHLNKLLSFLNSAGKLASYEGLLKEIFFGSFEKGNRQTALNFFLKLSPEKNMNFFLESLDELDSEEAEIILTKEILGWSGPTTGALVKKIKEKGSMGSKMLIEKKEKKLAKQEENDSIQYSNAKEIIELGLLRNKVNEISLTLFRHKIFPDDETLFSHIETAKDRESLSYHCTSLRDVIQNIEEAAKEHTMNVGTAGKYIQGINTQTLNKSINALNLYLLSKDIPIESNFFGLRSLLKILSILGAHKEDQELIPILKTNNLIEFYNTEQWGKIHKELLKKYKSSLEQLLTTLMSARNKN